MHMNFAMSGATSDRDIDAASTEMPGGTIVEMMGAPCCRISNVDCIPPFFVSVVGNGDVWLYASSHGPFVGGRRDPEGSFFPYQTVDRILRHDDSSGALTAIRVNRNGKSMLWEPWKGQNPDRSVIRHFYKDLYGTFVVYEELCPAIGLSFKVTLRTSETFGIVRRCELANLSGEPVDVEILDGWHEVLPPGVGVRMMADSSYLAHAYMRHEAHPSLGLAVFTLNAKIVDRAEPAENLRAACAWSPEAVGQDICMTGSDVDRFRRGESFVPVTEARGCMGRFRVRMPVSIRPDTPVVWTQVLDSGLDHAALIRLRDGIASGTWNTEAVEASTAADRDGVIRRVASADGLQNTADVAACGHHYANQLFNIMRGGVFPDAYRLPVRDVLDFLRTHNPVVAGQAAARLADAGETIGIDELEASAASSGDPQFIRLAGCYLPLVFSRRHGDPSRPWNHFSIRLKDGQGQPVYYYQGNWRDLFQNWEALAASFPRYLGNMIRVFLNASTADGYNPYRITRDGIDWEEENPEDPWSFIGYWGDHQIMYLLKLLEAHERYFPGMFSASLGREEYAYARVPYVIKAYDELVRDPRSSIRFDAELHETLIGRAATGGADAKLHALDDGSVILVPLIEKLLVPVLVKLTNLVPDGGIWMNTQRPEWNDANNALAGWGLSLVTACAIRRYLVWLQDLVAGTNDVEWMVTAPLAGLVDELASPLQEAADIPMDGKARRRLMDRLGRAGERHRNAVYCQAFEPRTSLRRAAILDILEKARAAIERTLRNQTREDGLYHSYRILELTDDGAAVIHDLDPMLEGQVAMLSSGILSGEEAERLCASIRDSRLYREDQSSYTLYPDRKVPSFFDRNRAPAVVGTCELGKRLLREGGRGILTRDMHGDLHFGADLTNARDLAQRLAALAGEPGWLECVDQDRSILLDAWESVFDHRSFTGRSGTMFGFEGLGSIYWHMVSKYLLSVMEQIDGTFGLAGDASRRSLAAWYYRIQRGLGYRKTPKEFGAVPLDPYSHTPGYAGAQQPGMTGQVKEEVLTRFGELGVNIRGGMIRFDPAFLLPREFHREPYTFSFLDGRNEWAQWPRPAKSLCFTLCRIPVSYVLEEAPGIICRRTNQEDLTIPGLSLPQEVAAGLFDGTTDITRIEVCLPASAVGYLVQ